MNKLARRANLFDPLDRDIRSCLPLALRSSEPLDRLVSPTT